MSCAVFNRNRRRRGNCLSAASMHVRSDSNKVMLWAFSCELSSASTLVQALCGTLLLFLFLVVVIVVVVVMRLPPPSRLASSVLAASAASEPSRWTSPSQAPACGGAHLLRSPPPLRGGSRADAVAVGLLLFFLLFLFLYYNVKAGATHTSFVFR